MSDDKLVGGLLILFGIAAATVVGMGLYMAHKEHAKCTDNGGHWETYDCHVVTRQQRIQQYDYNNDPSFMACMPYEDRVCSERCVGAYAEVNNAR